MVIAGTLLMSALVCGPTEFEFYHLSKNGLHFLFDDPSDHLNAAGSPGSPHPSDVCAISQRLSGHVCSLGPVNNWGVVAVHKHARV